MERQVFQTANIKRWTRFRWTMRVLTFIFALFITALIIMLFIDKKPSLPFGRNFRQVITASTPFLQETKLSKEYKGFRDVITEKKLHTNYEKEKEERYKKFRRM